MDVVLIKRKRIAAKGWLTRASNQLDELLDKQNVSETELLDSIEEFQNRLRIVDEVQFEMETVLEIDELESDIENASLFREQKRIALLKAKECLKKLKPGNDEDSASVHSHVIPGQSVGLTTTKLPSLELPKFSGDYVNWQPFWDKFTAVVDASNIPCVNKFTYLQSVLQGEAAVSISGLSLTSDNYQTAKRILVDRFGRPERIVFSHIQKLMGLSSSHGTVDGSATSLWKLHDDIMGNVRSLENLGVGGDTYGVILTPLILHQLPATIRMEWARVGEGQEGNLDFLLSFLHEEIRRRERSQTFGKRDQPPDSCVAKGNRSRSVRGSASALMNVGAKGKSCAFCEGDHYSDKCPDIVSMTHAERKDKVKTLNLCFRCLSKGHKADKCDRRCYHCKGSHHSVLHINRDYARTKNDTEGGGVTLSCVSVSESAAHSPPDTCTDGGVSGVTENRAPSSHDAEGENTFSCVSESMTDSSVSVMYHNHCGQTTLMQCVKISVKGQDMYVLFDSGSDRTYIKSATAKKLGLKPLRKESLSFQSFAANESHRECPLFKLSVGGVELNLLGIDNICKPLFRSQIPEEIMKDLRNVPVNERLDKDNLIRVDILVGLDFYWSLVDGSVSPIDISEGLVAQKTKLGWMVSGSYANASSNVKSLAKTSLFCVQGPSEATVKQCWELDAIGIGGENASGSKDSEVFDNFCLGVSMNDNRYMVGLPWKSCDHKDMLVNNVNSALKRLDGLNKRLDSNPDLKKRYDEVFVDLEQQNMIEEVDLNTELESDNPVYYLPHRPVVREESQSTKVRPVFDASAKGENGVSLNDCMEVGPKLIPDLTGILLRFRRWQFGLTADIQKAFLQIELQEADRDVHRFLLRTHENQVRHMRFRRVTFGNASSPFMLNATLKLHLSKQKETRTIRELRDNLYVDDWLTGSDDEADLIKLIEEAGTVMKQGSFNLTKWASNSPEVGGSLGKAIHDASDPDRPIQKVLGVGWDTDNDSFHFSFLSGVTHMVFSKRNLLGMIARIFDPLGFIHPFTITLKIIFQEAWREGYDWDVILPEEIQQELEFWVSSLKTISKWKIPRRLSTKDWTSLDKIELIMFSDASEKAYGSCVYIISTIDNHSDVNLVISKVRVAPLKRVTLPRLELLAALLGARLLQFVRDALQLPDDTSYTCFTDSMITLGWIRGEPFKWKQFIRNRVTEIQSLTDSDKWRHCSGKDNPADLLTRGVSASCLASSSQWLKGPEWLLTANCSISNAAEFEPWCDLLSDTVNDIELENTEPICSIVSQDTCLIDFDRFSDFGKLVRVTGYVLKFIKKVRRLSAETDSVSDCLRGAKNVVFKLIQMKHYSKDIEELKRVGVVKKGSSLSNLCPFIGDDGLLRVKGRLNHAQNLSYDEKHPIILPNCHVSLLLVRSHHITLKHAGVNLLITSLRCKYWIVSIRPIAKRVVRFCIDCQRHDSRLLDQCMGSLPAARITQSPPFSVIGIDYAGPLFCSDVPGTKLYILLFTCAVTRAVHLELTDSLTTDDFLLAFKRFTSRRAMPAVVYSDNAQTFKRAQNLLTEHLGHAMFKWQSQPALAPWWGGFYERMVRTVKSSLRKAIGKKSIPRKELETALIEIEVCINSRPLTYTSDNDTYLTPSHFLVGRGCPLSLPELTTLNQVLDLSTLHDYHRSLLDNFWETWRSEYLRALPPLRGKLENTRLKAGSIVLIQDENKKRLLWDLGKVVKLYKGLDGCVRAAQIKTKRNCLVRPVQRLVLLELDHSDNFNLGYEDLRGQEVPEVQEIPSPSDSNDATSTAISTNVDKPGSVGDIRSHPCADPPEVMSHKMSRSGRIIKTPKILTL